ncbi:energy-coupling factor transporter ATP-binding protein EcfA2 [Paraburkholderia sp. GAS199]|uniref:AAA family ATPase n=1 Tax=Paraburkholderia sp. GAS199 TaxID=3035126 RepID=UPI003D231C67
MTRPISELTLENFRGFAGKHTLDLDADLVLISGKNGVGKTSILLALDLLLNGRTQLLMEMGDALTKGCTEGSVAMGGITPATISLSSLPAARLQGDLLERAHFFFPEGLATPENSDDILKIVSPSSRLWDEIKLALETAQGDLTEAKKNLVVRDFDVEISRRQAAQEFELARKELPEYMEGGESWAPHVRGEQNLLLQGGNLTNHWQSQLRNILKVLQADTAGDFALDDGAFSDNPADLLLSISVALDQLRNQAEERHKPDYQSTSATPLQLAALQRGPTHLPIRWENPLPNDADFVIDDETVILATRDGNANYKRRLIELEREASRLRNEQNDLRRRIPIIENGDDSLRSFLYSFPERSARWLASLQDTPLGSEKESVIVQDWLKKTNDEVGPMLRYLAPLAQKMKESEFGYSDQLARVSTKMEQLLTRIGLSEIIHALSEQTWARGAVTVGELGSRVEKVLASRQEKSSGLSQYFRSLHRLSKAAAAWAETEREIDQQVAKAATKVNFTAADKLMTEAERTLKRALGKESIFSLTSVIDDRQLGILLVTLNRLLARFHFPTEFLPIRLQPGSGKGKASSHQFVSAHGPGYRGLSTGQRTQLAVCWSVCLNYALRDKLSAPFLGFDDFTTALDMGQLIPAAGILRQLAYTNSDEYYRQVVVTSHHEDLTNRLVEYLLPPPGKTMRVIEIQEWTPKHGPKFKIYDARASQSRMHSNIDLGSWLNAQLGGRAR